MEEDLISSFLKKLGKFMANGTYLLTVRVPYIADQENDRHRSLLILMKSKMKFKIFEQCIYIIPMFEFLDINYVLEFIAEFI